MMTSLTAAQQNEVVRSFIARSYSWMAAGLVLTAGVAALTASNISMMHSVQTALPLLMLMQLGIVMGLSFLADRINAALAGLLFMVYAGLTGLTFSGLLLAFGPAVTGTTFLITAGTFGAMSAVGYFTKRDLSGMSGFLTFALIGLLLAMVVNMFLGNGLMTMVISGVGVLLFAALTAYDTQKLREMALSGLEGEMAERGAVHGALTLYLDFINMFLFILRLIGGGRD